MYTLIRCKVYFNSWQDAKLTYQYPYRITVQKSATDISPIIRFIFFGNYFYGLCAVGLSLETSFQLGYSLNSPFYYLLIFAGTVIYYTKAYLPESSSPTLNRRSHWYHAHHNVLLVGQRIWIGIFLIVLCLLLHEDIRYFFYQPVTTWLLILLFPIAALFYNGLNTGNQVLSVRSIGWLKPFCIGFIWAGVVTLYPILYKQILISEAFHFSPILLFLFIKNFMFISVLCIMFDIKDYAMDYNAQLKTFVVEFGLRKTIFLILIPLSLLGFGTFFAFGFTHHFSPLRLFLNAIPFLLLVLVTYSLHHRKSVLYYLIIIDGLMLVKAVCGSLGMIQK
jgi:hypothetical protein